MLTLLLHDVFDLAILITFYFLNNGDVKSIQTFLGRLINDPETQIIYHNLVKVPDEQIVRREKTLTRSTELAAPSSGNPEKPKTRTIQKQVHDPYIEIKT